jgi:hypothetical protein
MNHYDFLNFLCAAGVGFMKACMDARQWAPSGLKRIFFFLPDWFLFEKGKRYLGFLLWDFWHICSNLLLISSALAAVCASYGTLHWWYLLDALIAGVSFILFYHILFKAQF